MFVSLPVVRAEAASCRNKRDKRRWNGMAKTHTHSKRSVDLILTATLTVLGAAPSALANGPAGSARTSLVQAAGNTRRSARSAMALSCRAVVRPRSRASIFAQQWNGKSLKDLYSYVHDQMPLGKAGSLDPKEYADIVAYMLAQSGLPSGNQSLRRIARCSGHLSFRQRRRPTRRPQPRHR